MKVLFFSNLAPDKVGAFEQFAEAFGRRLGEGGGCLRVVFAGEPVPDVAERFKAAGVSWHVIEGWEDKGGNARAWRMVLPGLRILSAEKPDVVAVHFGDEIPTAALILLARIKGLGRTRWVWHQRQQMEFPRTSFHRKYSRISLLARVCDHFVALYEGGRKALVARGIPDNRISVIHNGVAESRPVRARGWLRKELGVPEESVIVTNVSSLIPRKRVDWAIRAVAKEVASGEGRGGRGKGQGARGKGEEEVAGGEGRGGRDEGGNLRPEKGNGGEGRDEGGNLSASGGSACGGKPEYGAEVEERAEGGPSPVEASEAKHLSRVTGREERSAEACLSNSEFRSQVSSFILLLVGTGPKEDLLRSLVADLGIGANVRFLGRRGDVREILAESDIHVLTSSAEASPLAVIEAMAAGIPSVVTDAGAARELIEDGRTGAVAGRDDEAMFAERLGRLVKDPVQRREWGRAAAARWRQSFSIDRMTEEHQALYRRIS